MSQKVVVTRKHILDLNIEVKAFVKLVNDSDGKAYPAQIYTPDNTDGNPTPTVVMMMLGLALEDIKAADSSDGFMKFRNVYYAISKNPRITELTINSVEIELKNYGKFWDSLSAEAQAAAAGYLGISRTKYNFASALIHRMRVSGLFVGTTDNRTGGLLPFVPNTPASVISNYTKLMSLPQMMGSKLKTANNRIAQMNANRAEKKKKKKGSRGKGTKRLGNNNQNSQPKKKRRENNRRNETGNNAPEAGVLKQKQKNRQVRSYAKMINKVRQTLIPMSKGSESQIQQIASLMLETLREVKNDIRFKDFKSILYQARNAIYNAGLDTLSKASDQVDGIPMVTPELVFNLMKGGSTELQYRHEWIISGNWVSKLPLTVVDGMKYTKIAQNITENFLYAQSYTPNKRVVVRAQRANRTQKAPEQGVVSMVKLQVDRIQSDNVVTIKVEGEKATIPVVHDTDEKYNRAKDELVRYLNGVKIFDVGIISNRLGAKVGETLVTARQPAGEAAGGMEVDGHETTTAVTA